MFILIVILNGTYLTDIHFQEFNSMKTCEISAVKIRKELKDAFVSCEIK